MMNENEEEAEKADVFHVCGKRIITIIAVVILVIAVLLGVVVWLLNNPIKSHHSEADQEKTSGEIQKENMQIDAVETAVSALAEIEAEAEQDEEGEYAAPHKTTEAVKLSDIYTVSGNMVQLECYYPGAESYIWEVYNRHTCAWETVDSESQQDELYRPVSVLHVAAEGTDTTSVRCTVGMEDGEAITENASIYIIPDIQDISVKESYVTDAGKYVSIREIPIQVSYVNGTQNIITGLNGATFVESTEKRELSSSGTGNPVETITTVYTESDYAYIGMEDKEFLLRYRCGEQILDTEITVSGKDLCAPEISDVIVSGFEITNVDTPVTANISITAEDDKTPYPDLEYAFVLKKDTDNDIEPDDADWTRKAVFDIDITQNGTWIAFCRDQSGNLASMEKEIIVVDQKAPVMSVHLADTGWCSSTKLIMDAEDYLPVEYRVITPTGTDSGWTTQNEYEVSCNGIWEVQSRDSVGNVSKKESITISNIDRQGPVIEKITTEKITPAEGGSNNNED